MLINTLRLIEKWLKEFKTFFKYNYYSRYNKKRYNRNANLINLKKDGINISFLKAYKKRWEKVKNAIDTERVILYTKINKNYDINYITEEFYKYYIEPFLCLKRYSSTIYQNKALIDIIPQIITGIDENIFPKTHLRNFGGVNYDSSFSLVKNPIELLTKAAEKYLVVKKNLDTGGGRDVLIFKYTANDYCSTDNNVLLSKYIAQNKDFVIQEYIKQSALMASLNATSLNTIRVITYRSVNDERIHVLHSIGRFGGAGDFTDNSGDKSSYYYIRNDGMAGEFIIRRDFKITQNKKFTIPGYLEMTEIAQKISRFFVFHRVIGYDFALDIDNNIKILEINPSGLNPEATNFLFGSFFGSFTDEVMEYVNKNK